MPLRAFAQNTLITWILLFYSGSLSADDQYYRVLVPIAVRNLPGAFDAHWETDTWIYSNVPDAVVIFPTPACPAGGCGEGSVLPSNFTIRAEQYANFPRGLLVHLRGANGSDVVEFSHRLRDVSRNGLSVGTDLPVVGEEDFRNAPVHLLGIPREPTTRYMLRVYALPQATGPRVRLEVFKVERGRHDELLNTRDVTLEPSMPAERQYFPAFAQIPSVFDDIPGIDPATTLRLTITPLDTARIWAFISATNNATSEVTIVAPN